MILLVATRLDDGGHFSYAIQAAGEQPVVTTDPATVTQELSRLGVDNPDPLVAHARNWGSLEIVERKQRDPQD
jgi:hypothetical protein